MNPKASRWWAILAMVAFTVLTFLILGGLAVAQEYPNPKWTPGVIRPDATAKQLCAKGFRTAPYRKTTATMKKRVCDEYHVTAKCPGPNQEIDHLLPLELGGLDDVRDLWPQKYAPRPGAHQKDVLENALKKEVCAGQMTLPDAQRCIMKDWVECFKQVRGVAP